MKKLVITAAVAALMAGSAFAQDANREAGTAAGMAGGAAAMAVLRFHDPHARGSYAYCPFLYLTGHPCPLCGGLRAMNDLTRGRIEDARALAATLPVLGGEAGSRYAGALGFRPAAAAGFDIAADEHHLRATNLVA